MRDRKNEASAERLWWKKHYFFKLKKSKCLSIWLKYMYDQLLRASDNAMRASSFFHPLVLQGEWVKK